MITGDIWNQIIKDKLFAFDTNILIHSIVCKLFVLDKKTQNYITIK